MTRYFQIKKNNETEFYGRYSGLNHSIVAKKALSKLLNKEGSINFDVKEITRNSDNKIFSYNGTKMLLDKTKIININNKEIEIKYKNIVNKIK
jgi:hypothetical protein